ncbi:DNA-binding transcriptional regulator, HxlR family [Thermomonospora echinospora]|uniref:DNA-binding transcriptional regulator, HxlR family n=1 Tax=Thermomonospora echinospora TaxID=1992 RepID=A0A1H6D3U4_9ACTN|nr:helix-turn-helix domain-containing protein [Thermomonospora echinospora]SEG79463.1 DNA-binding transcriptional regulator, HxlR family [Thermomonospora echinospora]
MQAIDPTAHSPGACQAREVLDRVGDKWSLYVISQLGSGTKRFNELKREIDGISQRMLTVTLRGLERDGIVTRTMYPVMPPRVEYSLTDLGRTLLETVGTFVRWAEENLDQIEAARARYDARAGEIEAFG